MTKLNVSNIQHFSVGDGPGIRTTLFLKGCNLHCPWCHNPETISPNTQALFFENANKRTVYGKQMTVDEVVAELTEDKDFYASDGGVTVSGGEPLLQSEAVAELLRILKSMRISTLVDTAGCVPWANFERVRGVTDIFYYDYKTANESDYSKIIGGQESLVYENLCRLVANDHTLHVRIPLIPSFNTSAADSEKICQKLLNAGVRNVDLLPFHRLGSSKYEALGKEYSYKNTEPQSRQDIEAIAKIYQKHFIVTIEK